MKNVLSVYKPIGKTPLQLIDLLRKERAELKNRTIGYAGRLDPMADGVLLLLIDEENKKRKEYERLTKEYLCDVLLGISTDTYDLLGLITHTAETHYTKALEFQTKKILSSLKGKRLQEYPPYSSLKIKGKPLFWWAREGKLSEITLPKKTIEVYEIEILGKNLISKKEIKNTVENTIPCIEGVFRQEKILKRWDTFFDQKTIERYPLLRLRISCSSGTYIRSLAHEIGQTLGIPTLCYKLTRTLVGNYTLENSLRLTTF